MLKIIEFGTGAATVALALADIFMTLLVPGPASGRFSVVLRVRDLSLPFWRRAARRRPDANARPSNSYAPVTFLLTFFGWLLLLLFGFAMMMHALGHLFSPRVDLFSDGVWIAGSSLLTLGVSEYDASGAARWLILAAALSGFGVISTAIASVLQVQTGLIDREPAVLVLGSIAGTPPSGVVLLETMAGPSMRGALPALLIGWRDWCAATEHSHLAYPGLNYYRSVNSEGDWLAAMEAVLDTATLVATCLTGTDADGPAELLHRMGTGTATRLCAAFRLDPEPAWAVGAELDEVLDRLDRAGYEVRREGAAHRFAAMRDAYAPAMKALARHLGGNRAPLTPDI